MQSNHTAFELHLNAHNIKYKTLTVPRHVLEYCQSEQCIINDIEAFKDDFANSAQDTVERMLHVQDLNHVIASKPCSLVPELVYG